MTFQNSDKIQEYVAKEIKRQNLKKTILDPKNKPKDFTWGEWQRAVKLVGLKNQNYTCSVCGSTLRNKPGELHHALLTRGNVIKNKQSDLIHHSHNCLVLHPDCHKSITKETSAKLLFYLYGKSVKEWYDNFPTKWTKPNIFSSLERMLEIER